METGFIKLFRCISHNYLWEEKPFDRARAWIDLILLANHKPATLRKRGILIKVDRGQVGWSERNLSERWGWSRPKVKRFLNELEGDLQIVQQNGPQNLNVTSLITITNYEKYQSDEPQNVPQKSRRTATDLTIDKNEKNEKKESIKSKVEKPVFEPPDWLPKKSWDDFLAMRSRIKKPVTPEAYHLAIAKLEKLRGEGNDPQLVLDQSTFHSWQGLFPIKQDSQSTTQTISAVPSYTPEQAETAKRAREVLYGNA